MSKGARDGGGTGKPDADAPARGSGSAGVPRPRRGRAVTIIDIAGAAGVSKSTVSLVLQGSASVRPETRARVEQAIERLGYVYNRGAADLRRARRSVIGMVLNDLTNPFYAEMAVGIERVMRAAGYVTFIANTAESPLREAEVFRSMREYGVAGIIVSVVRGADQDGLDALTREGVPVVLAMRPMRNSRLPLVTSDSTHGARLATDHLLAHGHRRIAFLGGLRDIGITLARQEGYRQALETAGIPFEEALTIESPATREGGMQALSQALGLGEPPTAALCFNDVVAFGVYLELARRGLTPGADFAVIGFDDVAEARHVVPALTTISVDPVGLGERAAHALLDMMRSGRTDHANVIGEVRLAVRESCGGVHGIAAASGGPPSLRTPAG